MSRASFSAAAVTAGATRAGTIENSRMWFVWMFSLMGNTRTAAFGERAGRPPIPRSEVHEFAR